MNHDYADIRSRIPEPPTWWDEHAVPRYGAFSPRDCANIYADEAALVLITCQGCGAEFRVAFSLSAQGKLSIAQERGGTEEAIKAAWSVTLAGLIRSRELHYGDPPNVGCCPAGPTMNSEPRRVLEYWERQHFEWARNPALEIGIEPDWVDHERG